MGGRAAGEPIGRRSGTPGVAAGAVRSRVRSSHRISISESERPATVRGGSESEKSGSRAPGSGRPTDGSSAGPSRTTRPAVRARRGRSRSSDRDERLPCAAARTMTDASPAGEPRSRSKKERRPVLVVVGASGIRARDRRVRVVIADRAEQARRVDDGDGSDGRRWTTCVRSPRNEAGEGDADVSKPRSGNPLAGLSFPEGPRRSSRRSPSERIARLLDLDRGAGLFQLLLELLGVLLGDAGLDRLGGGLDRVLGLLQAQRRWRPGRP